MCYSKLHTSSKLIENYQQPYIQIPAKKIEMDSFLSAYLHSYKDRCVFRLRLVERMNESMLFTYIEKLFYSVVYSSKLLTDQAPPPPIPVPLVVERTSRTPAPMSVVRERSPR